MNIKFTMHDGREFVVFIEAYSAKEIETLLNNRQQGEYISFGDAGFIKHGVKYFEPAEDTTPVVE